MATASTTPPTFGRDGNRMTIAEFRELPDDGIERELLAGVVRVIDEQEAMTKRGTKHSRSMSRVDSVLERWLEAHPAAEGAILSGEAGIDLPIVNLAVGADVAYFRLEDLPADFEDDDPPYVEAAPALAVEILSRSDKAEQARNRVKLYLAAGVAAVWILDPVVKTVTSHGPGRPPRMTAGDDPVTEPDVLPGFEVPASAMSRLVIRKSH